MKLDTKTLRVYSKDIIKAFYCCTLTYISILNHTQTWFNTKTVVLIVLVSGLLLLCVHRDKCSSGRADRHLLTCSQSLRFGHHSLSELCLAKGLLSRLCTNFVPLYCWPTQADLYDCMCLLNATFKEKNESNSGRLTTVLVPKTLVWGSTGWIQMCRFRLKGQVQTK